MTKPQSRTETTIITPARAARTMPVGKQMYPLLADFYGDDFDPYDNKIQKSLRHLLSEILQLLEASKEGLKVNDFAGNEVNYL